MKKFFLTSLVSLACLVSSAADFRYVGGDISLYPTYEAAGSRYKDTDGNSIQLLPYLYDLGMNAMRVRLFVDPAAFQGLHPDIYDPNACQSLPYILPLCKDILDNGFDLMLDFHYSDTWADPGAQWIPNAWKGLTNEELVEKIYEYTKDTLITLQSNGIVPKFIQPGNEISYGMLWSEYGQNIPEHILYDSNNAAGWQRFGELLRSAIKACREVCPDAEIIIHTERVEQVGNLRNFYDKMKSLDIDYDIIGLSYYPYFHGKISVLNTALTYLEKRYPDKPIMIVETGFPYKYEVQGTDHAVDYPYTYTGQDTFAHDLVDTLLAHPNVNGLFWWWLEYNAFGAGLTGWYNAPLFDSSNGKALPAIKTIASFGTGHDGIESIEVGCQPDGETWYDLQGQKISRPSRPGIYIKNGEKVMVR